MGKMFRFDVAGANCLVFGFWLGAERFCFLLFLRLFTVVDSPITNFNSPTEHIRTRRFEVRFDFWSLSDVNDFLDFLRQPLFSFKK
jgi:hypothetical protein